MGVGCLKRLDPAKPNVTQAFLFLVALTMLYTASSAWALSGRACMFTVQLG